MKNFNENWYSEQLPAMQAEFRQYLKELLQEYEVILTFKKTNGEVRVMRATTKSGIVPIYERKTDRPKTPSIETCSVYDLNKGEWRSFRYDRLISVQFLPQSQQPA